MALFFNAVSPLTTSMLAAGTAAASFPVRELGGHEVVDLPGGPFVMGSSEFINSPPHWVTLSSFSIGRTAVTAGQYRERVEERDPRINSLRINSLQEDYPVTYVNWNDAQRYVQQLSQETGTRIGLPTEAQWEYDARGPAVNIRERMEEEGIRPGDFVDWADGRFENFSTSLQVGAIILTDPRGEALQRFLETNIPLYGWRIYGTPSGRLTPDEAYYAQGEPTRVDWGPANAHNLKGMTGGVWEWVGDLYGQDSYYLAVQDPTGPDQGSFRGLRGGSWGDVSPGFLRVAFRGLDHPQGRDDGFGFRFAAVPEDS